MASDHSSPKVLIPVSHLPTVMLVVGYLVYWLELYVLRATNGVTSPLAPAIFLLIAVVCLFQQRGYIGKFVGTGWKQFLSAGLLEKVYVTAGSGLCLLILAVTFYASLLPPHLQQEFDSLNYHITIPRQHLIMHSFFNFLPWVLGDAFLLPIDFALAPYWLVTPLPNKAANFFFVLGLLGVAVGVIRKFSSESNILKRSSLVLFAILGSHGIGIQMGTAMLDIMLCYLFVAALDSFLKQRMLLALIEFTFFFWSKPFIPLQMGLITGVLLIVWLLLKTWGINNFCWGLGGENEFSFNIDKKFWSKWLIGFSLLSIVIAGPFIAKSIYFVGTPLFPFVPGLIKINPNIDYTSQAWQEIMIASQTHMQIRHVYGHGHSLIPFLKHFWLIAVPEKDVNNSYDYPLGLPYLLFAGPFIYFFIRSIRRRKFSVLAFFLVINWLSWWCGSHQARFLYVPLILMFLMVAVAYETPLKALQVGLIVALLLNGLSLVRAHKPDFGRAYSEVLRPEDREIVKMNEDFLRSGRSEVMHLNHADAAFAQFPVVVTKASPP